MAVKRGYSRNRRAPLRSMIKRIDDKELKRTQGRWYGVVNQVSGTFTGKYQRIVLPGVWNGTAGRPAKIYGIDLLINWQSWSTSSSAAPTGIQAAIMVCHVRVGQQIGDFFPTDQYLPQGEEWGPIARPRSFLPVTIQALANKGVVDKSILTIPYRPFRGSSIRMLPNEQLVFTMASYGPVGNCGCTFNLSGRYRYIPASTT